MLYEALKRYGNAISELVQQNIGGGTTINQVGGGNGVLWRTLLLKDSTVGDDIGDHVTSFGAIIGEQGTIRRVSVDLRKAITSDYSLRIRTKWQDSSVHTATQFVVPSSTPVDHTLVWVPPSGAIPTIALPDLAKFIPDVLASDGQKDSNGILSITIEWTTRSSGGAAAAMGFVFLGDYAGDTVYAKNDMVRFSGAIYISKHDGNTGNSPDTHPDDWVFFIDTASGAVTSIDADTDTNFLDITGVPIGTSGTIHINKKTTVAAALVVASPPGGPGGVAAIALDPLHIPALPESKITSLVADLALKAPLASPALTGTPTAPTAAHGTNTTQLATTAFVEDAVAGAGAGSVTSVGLSTNSDILTVGSSPVTGSGVITLNKTTGLPANEVVATPDGTTGTAGVRSLVAADIPALPESKITSLVSDLALKAPLASPTFTGTPAAPTPTAGDNTTKLATTAFIVTALSTVGGGNVTNAAALTANLPIIGDDGAHGIKSGTRTGNTTKFATATGTQTQDVPLLYDANGNVVVSTRSGNTTQYVTASGALTSGTPGVWDANGNLVSGVVGGSAGGGLVTRESHSLSAVATIEFTSWYSSLYKVYELHIINFVPSTLAQTLYMVFSTNGGTSYDTSNVYEMGRFYWSATGPGTGQDNFGGNPQGSFIIWGANSTTNSATIGGIDAFIKIVNPGGSSHKHVALEIYGTNNDNVSSYGIEQRGRYKVTTPVNALKIGITSGTLTGDATIYAYAR